MKKVSQQENSQSAKTEWSVGVIYEDTHCREVAAKECDRLLAELWSEHGLKIQWWSFDMLAEAGTGSEALEKAMGAAVMIFALRPEGIFSANVEQWIETWLRLRGEREGAMIGLMDPCVDAASRVSEKYVYLH